MSQLISSAQRRLFAPEVVQTSAMDCGPAALKCLLEGFGLPVDYGRLREACQTDVDGTSVNTLEDVAQQCGLVCRQLLAPVDHLLLPEAQLLPALVVTVQPTGLTHFVVVWRVVGAWVQIMDPALGRRWLTRAEFTQQVYAHRLAVSAAEWRAWAGGQGFCGPLRVRLGKLGLTPPQIDTLMTAALADPHWRPLATLDAAARLVAALIDAGGLWRGPENAGLLESYLNPPPGAEAPALIPSPYWTVTPATPRPDPADQTAAPEERLTVRGAVAMAVMGRQLAPQGEPQTAPPATPTPRSRDLAAALRAPSSAVHAIWTALRADGLLAPGLLIPALLLAALGVTVEAAIFRGLMDLQLWLADSSTRSQLAVGILAFGLVLFVLEAPLPSLIRRLGRRLETRLRVALLTKLPRLSERYFHSRLISDMAHRAYSLRQLDTLPNLLVNLTTQAGQLLFTMVGIIWLAPASTPIILGLLGAIIALALVGQSLTGGRDLRVRVHAGALSRFYLDALLGLVPIRTHSAARAVTREHEMLLVAWVRAGRALAGSQVLLQAVASLIGLSGAVAIVVQYVGRGSAADGVLLVLYWALKLPTLAQALMTGAQQYPAMRNRVQRLLEPLGAPEEAAPDPQAAPVPQATPPAPAAALALEQVTVVATGHTLLHDLDLTIAPGTHVAIVGPSGAGKSTLVGLFLGWHRPATGQILVDGSPLTEARLHDVRRMTAWVDPAVQIWNRTLAANLRYGLAETDDLSLEPALELAGLDSLLPTLENGLATNLGESGGLLSGGEGQRVRLGRALLRPHTRLAILDEPFRGLDHTQRRQLLATTRQHWRNATLLCITHDVVDTLDFDRVLVMEAGRIVEDGAPHALLAPPAPGQAESRYRAMFTATDLAMHTLWRSSDWRELHMQQGVLVPAR